MEKKRTWFETFTDTDTEKVYFVAKYICFNLWDLFNFVQFLISLL